MTIGPVQLLVVGFEGGELNDGILAELDQLRESDMVRLIDLMAVRKDADGSVEKLLRSDLSPEEAEAFGALVGALVGFGAAGEDGAELGCNRGNGGPGGRSRLRRGGLVRRGRDPERHHRRRRAARAPLGDPAAREHPQRGRLPPRGRLDPPRRPSRHRAPRGRGGRAAARNVVTFQRSVIRREAPCSSALRSGMSSSCC